MRRLQNIPDKNVNGLKKYGDLNFDVLRNDIGIDLVHYTCPRGHRWFELHPMDYPARCWRGGKPSDDYLDYTFILFKNAEDMGGYVTKEHYIENETFLETKFKDDIQAKRAIDELQRQLGTRYLVQWPPEEECSVEIRLLNN